MQVGVLCWKLRPCHNWGCGEAVAAWMQFADVWLQCSSLLAGNCTHLAARKQGAGRSRGSTETTPSCPALLCVQGKLPVIDTPPKPLGLCQTRAGRVGTSRCSWKLPGPSMGTGKVLLLHKPDLAPGPYTANPNLQHGKLTTHTGPQTRGLHIASSHTNRQSGGSSPKPIL